jgi:integrase
MRRNPFPGVTRTVDRHGRTRWRFRRMGFTVYLHGAYGSVEFRAEYEAALAGWRTPATASVSGSLAWLIEQYLGSPRYRDLSQSRKRSIRGELDWLRVQAGDLPYAHFRVRHVESLMDRKTGPTAANTVKKNLSMLFNFAAKKLDFTGQNPARHADKRKVNRDGYHTWTEGEIDRFLALHGPGTKARLVALLALNTGMSRQDLARAGWQNVKDGRIAYRRGKTGVGADLPILPELASELDRLPRGTMLFLTHGMDLPYKPETLGNWFRDRCTEAGVPGALHGLRKAGATRLANAGATPDEIRAFLAHETNAQGSTYTKAANRAQLADSGMEKVSNLSPKLDKGARK